MRITRKIRSKLKCTFESTSELLRAVMNYGVKTREGEMYIGDPTFVFLPKYIANTECGG